MTERWNRRQLPESETVTRLFEMGRLDFVDPYGCHFRVRCWQGDDGLYYIQEYRVDRTQRVEDQATERETVRSRTRQGAYISIKHNLQDGIRAVVLAEMQKGQQTR